MCIESLHPAALARGVTAGRSLRLAALAATLALSACSLLPERPSEPDGTWCYRIGRTDRRTVTCTPSPVPPREVEQSAKQFRPDPNSAAIYVVRKRLGDVANHVPVVIDGQPPVITVPSSMFRVRGGARGTFAESHLGGKAQGQSRSSVCGADHFCRNRRERLELALRV